MDILLKIFVSISSKNKKTSGIIEYLSFYFSENDVSESYKAEDKLLRVSKT